MRGVFLLGLLAAVAVGGWLYWQYTLFERTPLAIPAEGDTLVVERGTSFNGIVRALAERDYTGAHPLYWRALAWRTGNQGNLRAGEYALTAGMTPAQVLDMMAKGRVVERQFTIVEGWSFRELRAALAKAEHLRRETEGLSDADLMAKLGADGVHPEGRFLPETYRYPRNSSDLDLLKRAYADMQAVLAAEWEGRAANLPISTPDEALVLASIVEKETGLASERPQIAGVFVRRLEKGMLLQTDPTVIYGIGPSFDGNLTRVHLETDTPYNTYTRAGLPPTPIALPGRAAIHAALHPAPGDTLYFVSRGDGSHVFTRSLDEHQRAVNEFQLRRRR